MSTFELSQTLLNPSPDINDAFGQDVTISGDRILISAHLDDTEAADSGVSYLFNTDGTLLQTFFNPTPAAGDNFGQSAYLDGNDVLIGAYLDDAGGTDNGEAYLFNTDGTLLQTFFNPTPAAGDNFGIRVAIDEDQALISASFDDEGATDSGEAYLFNTDGTLLQTFDNPNPGVNERFGALLDISGDNVLISSFLDDDETGVLDGGAVYLFNANDENFLQTFVKPGTVNASDRFGERVAISGDQVLIASILDDTAGTNAGAVYLFNTDGSLEQTFLNPNPDSSNGPDGFGQWLATSGDSVFIGAPGEDLEETNSGVVYQFDAITGDLIDTIGNPTADPNDGFGHRVVISDDTLVISAVSDDTGATDSGAAYVFQIVEPLNLVGTNQQDTLIGAGGDDTISGGNGADELLGLGGDDILDGDNGPDLLNGGLGNDTLTGGNGPDIFVLAPGEGTDTITDFSSPDVIGLADGLTFGDLSFADSDIIFGTETLATLTGIDTTTLTASDFTIV